MLIDKYQSYPIFLITYKYIYIIFYVTYIYILYDIYPKYIARKCAEPTGTLATMAAFIVTFIDDLDLDVDGALKKTETVHVFFLNDVNGI